MTWVEVRPWTRTLVDLSSSGVDSAERDRLLGTLFHGDPDGVEGG